MSQTATFLRPSEIEARASLVLKEHGTDDPPVDPIDIANAVGIRVFYAEFEDEKTSGMLQKEDGENWEILVNSIDPPSRQRFTIAHELGHYFLHRDQADLPFVDTETTIFRTNDGKPDWRETQANMFAASLLMPHAMFASAIIDTDDLGDLSKIFLVSRSAAGHRLSKIIDIDA